MIDIQSQLPSPTLWTVSKILHEEDPIGTTAQANFNNRYNSFLYMTQYLTKI
jgi:hypothetical protein